MGEVCPDAGFSQGSEGNYIDGGGIVVVFSVYGITREPQASGSWFHAGIPGIAAPAWKRVQPGNRHYCSELLIPASYSM